MLVDLVRSLPGHRILVVGDIMLDEYIWGAVSRISPEAPVPVVDVQRRTVTLGGAANVAANVVGLQGQVALGGAVGEDSYAATVRDELAARGLAVDGLVAEAGRPTTLKTRVVAHNQQVVRVDAESRQPLSTAGEQRLLDWIEAQLVEAEACLLSDYGKGVLTDRVVRGCIEKARRLSKPVLVDPKGVDYRRYRGATLITPNQGEAECAVNGAIQSDADVARVGQALQAVLGDGSAVLITRGAQGMMLFTPKGEPVSIEAAARQVFDVTGAGDTVIATLVLGLAAGATLEEAARLANTAAGIVVGKVGTAAVTLAELEQAVMAGSL